MEERRRGSRRRRRLSSGLGTSAAAGETAPAKTRYGFRPSCARYGVRKCSTYFNSYTFHSSVNYRKKLRCNYSKVAERREGRGGAFRKRFLITIHGFVPPFIDRRLRRGRPPGRFFFHNRAGRQQQSGDRFQRW